MNENEAMIYLALILHSNYIETDDVVVSASDAISSGRSEIIYALTTEQQDKVVRLRYLASDILQGKYKLVKQ